MPRNLDDVLDYFLPTSQDTSLPAAVPRREHPAALPVLTVPIGPRDAVRAGFLWNLGIELTKLGARTLLVAPRERSHDPLWPEPGSGPLGCQVHYPAAHDAASLANAASDLAVENVVHAPEGGLVLAAVPTDWLDDLPLPRSLLRWVLLWSTPDPGDLRATYSLLKRAYGQGVEDAVVGIVVHGVRRWAEARSAFDRVAGVSRRHLARTPVSYGLLTDDLHVYRAIAAGRPIGIEHPQSRAARALGDIAGMLWEDARKRNLV